MNKSVEYAAPASDIDTYQRDGVVCLKGAFEDWVDRLRQGFERNLAKPGPYVCESTEEGEAGRFFDDYCNWERIPEYKHYVLDSSAASMAGQFMRSYSAQFFHEHVFVKEPGTARSTPWHQDLPYYCVDGRQTVSIYVSLDAVPEDIGVHFVAGSHRWDILYFPRHFINGAYFDHDDPQLRPVPDIEGREDDYKLLSWALEPGDAVLFDFRTLHGTTNGLVTTRRRAFSTRWMGDDVRFVQRPGETSPPYPGIGLQTGDRMREDWFPIVWQDVSRVQPGSDE